MWVYTVSQRPREIVALETGVRILNMRGQDGTHRISLSNGGEHSITLAENLTPEQAAMMMNNLACALHALDMKDARVPEFDLKSLG